MENHTQLISTDADAANLELLNANSVSHIVNCAVKLPNHFPNLFNYLRLELKDPDEGLINCIDEVCGFIDQHVSTGNIFVHCQAP